MNFTSSVKIIFISLLSVQFLGGCGLPASSLLVQEPVPAIVQTQSFGGVYNEIEAGIFEAFGEMDENQDGLISPAEFGVDSPNKMVTFRQADLNHDGKITMNEMMPDELTKLTMAQKMKMTASAIYNRLDIAPRDNKLTPAELSSAVVSKLFNDFFLDYDTEKDTKNYLSRSEFQNLFAYIASSNFPNNMGEADVINPSPAAPTKAKAPAKIGKPAARKPKTK